MAKNKNKNKKGLKNCPINSCKNYSITLKNKLELEPLTAKQ
jgi:hypothetical protein